MNFKIRKMTPRFKILKSPYRYSKHDKYIIEKRHYIIYPFVYEMVEMNKSDFFPNQNLVLNDLDSFKKIDDVYDALYQYSKIHGYSEIIIKLEI